jgi:hypothetical protein
MAMRVSVFAVLALLISSSVLAKEEDKLPVVSKDDLLAVRTVQIIGSESFFPADAAKRLVEAIQIDVENGSSDRCSGRVSARFFIPGDDQSGSLGYLSAQPGESKNSFISLPRPVLVDPAAMEYPDDILLVATKAGSATCLVTITVYSRPGPSSPPNN